MDIQVAISELLYQRLGAQVRGFETPAQVIERILDHYEKCGGSASSRNPVEPSTAARLSGKLDISFIPKNQSEFKQLLLEKKEAYVVLYKTDGTKIEKHWIAKNFSQASPLVSNLRSGYLRKWREKGISRAVVAIDKGDIVTE